VILIVPVSLVITVLNEGESIQPLLESIATQTRPPDEILISDGGSTDNTVEVVQSFAARLPIRLIHVPGANISAGRNAAIREAQYPIIAVTDAGVRLEPDWLERLTAPFEERPDLAGVAGFFSADPRTAFEVAMGATVLPTVDEIKPGQFMPSSRSAAFRKTAWEGVGGYPEWLDFGEDLVFDFRIAARYGLFHFAPQAVVHFRPRSSLRAFWRQYFLYARGDGKADLFPLRHLIRYLTYFAALPILIAAALLNSPLWWLALIPGAAFILSGPYLRLVRQWGDLDGGGKLTAALWVPVIRVGGDLAKMVGYPIGRVWRLRNRPPEWRIESEEAGETRYPWLNRWLVLDTRISDRLSVGEQPGVRRTLAALITHTGDALTLVPVMVVAYWFGDAWLRAVIVVWFTADILTAGAVQVLKVILRRARPIGEWGKFTRRIDPHSFPSGHSARGGALIAVALALAPPWAKPIFVAWGLLLALSRVLLGIHFPSDALGGLALGFVLTCVLLSLLPQ
jgi:glycosyltransferase involved in cell wall biosynthesis/membrane-associated phospholipid phosphatase